MMPVYNSQHPYMLLPSCKALIIGMAVGLLLTVPGACAADWSAPAQALAQKIVAVTGPGAIALEISNRSSLTTAEVDQAHNALVSELGTLGVQVMGNAQAATVRVTFSENSSNYLWVAEVRQSAGDDKVVMVSIPGMQPPATFSPASPISIHRTLLWSQESPILDAILLPGSNPQHLIVLDANKVTVFSGNGVSWHEEQAFPIAHTHPWPRDVRGRLVFSKEHLFDAYLPGVICEAMLTSPLSMVCHEADDPWPLGAASFNVRAFFSPARNFFTGVLVPAIGSQNTFLPFYSAAPLPRPKYVLWALAGVDGTTHMVDGINDVTPKVHWGSDIAALKSSCGSGWHIVASSGNGTTDRLRAYEVADREPVAVGAAVDFTGPVIALWSKDDGDTAVAVVHNGETGKYEAFSLAIACHQ